METKKPDYIMGTTSEEIHRLEKQGKFLSGLTRDLLVRAGIEPGMRLLDFGSGAGDVSILASELVGPKGQVVAIDRSPEALDHARARLDAMKIENVHLVHGDESHIPEIMGERKFDALVGRLVLLHQHDPIAIFSRLVEFVRPGGIVAFQEVDLDCRPWSIPTLPLVQRTWDLISETYKRGGFNGDLATRLIQAFEKTGIKARRILLEGLIETGPDSLSYDYLSNVLKSLLPHVIELGLATAEEVDIATLPERIKAEALESQAIFTPVYLVSAFGHKQGHRASDLVSM